MNFYEIQSVPCASDYYDIAFEDISIPLIIQSNNFAISIELPPEYCSNETENAIVIFNEATSIIDSFKTHDNIINTTDFYYYDNTINDMNKLAIYCTNYNILQVMSGMATLSYSS